MSDSPVYSNILIVNTRTGGENPNVLIANFDGAYPSPQLIVNKKEDGLPQNCYWNIVYDNPGAQFRIEISDQSGDSYCLAAKTEGGNGTFCELIKDGRAGYCTTWAIPFGTRLLSGLGSGLNPYDGKDGTLSLDAGKYPSVMVWSFVSSVNQTWQFGYDMTNLQGKPYNK